MKIFRFVTLSLCMLLVISICQAQDSYSTAWKKVDDLIQKQNLPKTALEEVKKLYIKARNENQDAQVIRALVYISNLQQETREEAGKLAIRELEKEMVSLKEPSLSI